MSLHAAITVYRGREEIERLWRDPHYRKGFDDDIDAAVRFEDAPGDRGTEIHVQLADDGRAGRLGGMVKKLQGAPSRAKAMDQLRHFKQLVETGEVARSDAVPEGERAERKVGQRPAQPLEESDLAKASA